MARIIFVDHLSTLLARVDDDDVFYDDGASLRANKRRADYVNLSLPNVSAVVNDTKCRPDGVVRADGSDIRENIGRRSSSNGSRVLSGV